MFNHLFGTVTQTSSRVVVSFVVDASNVVVVCVVFGVDVAVVVDIIVGVVLVVIGVEGTADDIFEIIIENLGNIVIQ